VPPYRNLTRVAVGRGTAAEDGDRALLAEVPQPIEVTGEGIKQVDVDRFYDRAS